jgi:Flp pilus assembly secretin CpaC
LESELKSLFPASSVRLTYLSSNLLVEGQAKDDKEAAEIMAVVRHAAAFGISTTQEKTTDSAIPADSPQRPVTLRVTNMLRVPEMRKLALHVRVLRWDRDAAKELVANTNGRAAQMSALATSLLDATSGRAATILDSTDSADLDRAVAFLAAQKVLSPLHDQTLTTESGRSVTLIARGVVSSPSGSGLASVIARTAASRAQDLVVTCLPTVADRERIRLKVVPEIGIAGRTTGASRFGDPGTVAAMVMREGQTMAIAGLEEDAVQPQFPGAMPFLPQAFKARTPAAGPKDFVVLVTPQLTQPSAETEMAEVSRPDIRGSR